MPEIIVRDGEGDDLDATPLWDTIWSEDIAGLTAGGGDWLVADPAVEVTNVGGLSSQNNLATAIIICLFTDKRRPDWLTDGDAGPRGWHGDTFDIDDTQGERAMGSLLWTLERAALTDDTIRKAEGYVRESLQTLIDQGAVYDFDVTVESDKPNSRMGIFVLGYDKSGQTIFKNSFPFLV